MNFRTFIKVFIIIFISQFSIGQSLNSLPVKEKRLIASEVFGYTFGIENAFDVIPLKFPELSRDVAEVKNLYNSHIGKSNANAYAYLKETMSEKDFKDYNKILNEVMLESKEQHLTNITKEQSIEYLKGLRIFFSNNDASPITEYILSFQFQDNPAQEFKAGYTYTFNAKNHIKSKNTDWQIRLPKSWVAKEGNYPNVIQKFVSDCGNGSEVIVLLVQDISDLEPENINDKAEFIENMNVDISSESFVNELIPSNSSLISSKPVKIDGNYGVMINIESKAEQMATTIKSRGVWFVFVKDFKLYFLQAFTSSQNTEENLESRMNKFSPLFYLIANSIIVNDVKEDIIYLKEVATHKIISTSIDKTEIDFMLDTGATVSLLDKGTINILLKNGSITNENYVGKTTMKIADGTIVNVELWSIPQIKIGNRIIKDALFGVIDNNEIQPLLGMNILNKLNILNINLEQNKIYLKSLE